MSALLSFIGGSAFRAVWGELSAAWTRYQEHKHELEMIQAQEAIDAARHARALELQKQQAELGIKVIEAQAEAEADLKDLDMILAAHRSATVKTGIVWIDAWRQSIQPALASVAILIWVVALNAQGYAMTEWDREIVGAILGVYLANRHLSHRGK